VFLRDGRVCEEVAGASTQQLIETLAHVQPPVSDSDLAEVGGTAAGIGV
jgi:hypothetical protein